jgi:queuosine precursor transporter
MSSLSIDANTKLPQIKYLWFLTLSYSMLLILANWFDARLINLFSFVTDAGTLVFPLTFLLSDLITEVYGYKHARLAIWCGFFFNLVFVFFGHLVTFLPSPSFANNNAAFDSLIIINTRIIISSCISYLCSEPLNSIVMSKLKIMMKGRYIGIRFILSTIVASGLDSFIFGALAFYNQISLQNLISLILNMWLIKVVIEIIGLPISIRLAHKLKIEEKIDIYDKNTNYNLFSLETNYSPSDNKFDKKNS